MWCPIPPQTGITPLVENMIPMSVLQPTQKERVSHWEHVAPRVHACQTQQLAKALADTALGLSLHQGMCR